MSGTWTWVGVPTSIHLEDPDRSAPHHTRLFRLSLQSTLYADHSLNSIHIMKYPIEYSAVSLWVTRYMFLMEIAPCGLSSHKSHQVTLTLEYYTWVFRISGAQLPAFTPKDSPDKTIHLAHILTLASASRSMSKVPPLPLISKPAESLPLPRPCRFMMGISPLAVSSNRP